MTEMLSRRDYATGELRDKLKRYGYRDQEIDACLAKAADLRFIDATLDRLDLHRRTRKRSGGVGRRKIERELSLRGVSIEDIPGYPDEYFTDEEDLERACALLARKSLPDDRAFEKLVRHLMGKGFSYGVAAQAARRRIDDSR